MNPHRRTRKGGEEKCSCRFDNPILELKREPQMTKLCREYKDGDLNHNFYRAIFYLAVWVHDFIPDG